MKDDFTDATDETDSPIDDMRLQALLAQARQLPKTIEPPASSWNEIRAAIDTTTTVGAIGSGSARARPNVVFWQRPAFLIAAGALLVAGTSAITTLVNSSRPDTPPSAVVASAPVVRQPSEGPATLAEFTVVENDYVRMANQLSKVLQSDESNLAPETIAKLNESLRIIDAAIQEARGALAADPANSAIVESLSGTYEQKLDLLRRMTEMARS